MYNVLGTVRKRLPLILLLLTLISFGAMIFVRVSGSGTKLIETEASKGRIIALFYHSSIVIFVVIFILFILSVVYVNARKAYRKKKRIPDEAEYDPESEFEKEQAPYITEPVEVPGYETVRPGAQTIQNAPVPKEDARTEEDAEHPEG